MNRFDDLPRPVEVHVALGDPGGPPHAGDQLDCPACRAALLDAFRTEPQIPERMGPVPPDPGPADNPVPYPAPDWSEPINPSRWIDRASGTPFDRAGCLFCQHDEHPGTICGRCTCGETRPRPAVHSPVWGTDNGIWRVVCNCGWRREGRYPIGYGSDYLARAAKMAQDHQLHPEKGEDA